MPIVNCTIAPDLECEIKNNHDLIKRWSIESGFPEGAKEMTINIVRSEAQYGNQYKIIANLFLPSLWSSDALRSLQCGLDIVLRRCFSLRPDEILIITHVIDSGLIVDKGEVVEW